MGLFGQCAQPLLRDRDYLPVALPTADVGVLQVLTRQRNVLRRYSDLDRVLAGAEPGTLPAVSANQPVVETEGAWRRTAKAGIGLGIVSALLQALGANVGVHLSVAAARTVEYGYAGVTADRVDLASLDAWLAGADFRPGLRNITDLLAAEEVYVIVGALKASSVWIRLLDDGSAGVEVDVPAIQGVVGAKVSVEADAKRSDHLTFHGEVPVTVAAKAAQLKFDEQGFWVSERPVSHGEIRALNPAGASYLSGPELVLG
jgi:hypothetical protein